MRKSFKLIFVLALTIVSVGLHIGAMAQKIYDKTTAVVNYNEDKLGTGAISYNTSFLIYNTAYSPEQLAAKENFIKTILTDLRELKLTGVDNNSGVLVILNLYATDKQDLTVKMKKIFQELSVELVESNEVTTKVLDFKFQ